MRRDCDEAKLVNCDNCVNNVLRIKDTFCKLLLYLKIEPKHETSFLASLIKEQEIEQRDKIAQEVVNWSSYFL